MREYNALAGYPEPKEPRYVSPNLRTIHHRIVANYRGKEFYDGERIYGHGGLKYDGRWVPIARNMYREYGLKPHAAVLHIGCDKGFLLHDFLGVDPTLKVRGTEISAYPLQHAIESVKGDLIECPYEKLPFEEAEFDLVVALGSVYALNLAGAITCLKEIERVGKGRSFITLATYETDEEYRLFKYWTLLSSTILRKEEWLEVLKHVNFRGDYAFVSAKTLNLVEKKD